MNYFLQKLLLAWIPKFKPNVDPRLLGTWRSDAVATLADMDKHPEIPEKARQVFREELFGNRTVTYTATEYFSEFKTLKQRVPYVVKQSTKEYIDIEYFDALLKSKMTQRIFFDGERAYCLVSKFNFKEYYQRSFVAVRHDN